MGILDAVESQFYMNVVGYKVQMNTRPLYPRNVFYMNVVGYKAFSAFRVWNRRRLVLYERSGI